MKRLSLIAGGLLILGLMVVSCAPPPTPTPSVPTATAEEVVPTATATEVAPTVAPEVKGGRLIFALNVEPDNLDPHVTSLSHSHNVMMNIFDCLVAEDPETHEFVPWLAKSWDVSEDGLVWTFHLRDDVKFQDGTPFNAEAVKYSFDRMVDPATKSGMSATLLSGFYESTDVVDDYTVKITFSKPSAAFLGALSQAFLGIVSPTAAEEWGLDEFGSHPVGTGPFIFKSWDRLDQIVLVRNPDYNWAPSIRKHQGPAYLDELVFKIIPEDATRVAALEIGEVDAIEYVPPEEFARLEADPNVKLLRQVGTGMPESMLINVTKPPTDDLKVRQAIEHAVDREGIVNSVLFGVVGVANSPIASRVKCHAESLDKNYPYPYDPDKAKALLDEAGWKDTDGDGIRDKDGQPLHLLVITRAGIRQVIHEVVQAQLREVGIDVELQLVDVAAWLDIGAKGDHNIIPLGWAHSDPQVIQGCFGSENIGTGFNWSHFSNEEFDRIVQEAAVTLDPEESCRLYEQAQWIVMENAATIPIYEFNVSVFARAEVHDIVFDKVSFYRCLYDTWVEEK